MFNHSAYIMIKHYLKKNYLKKIK